MKSVRSKYLCLCLPVSSDGILEPVIDGVHNFYICVCNTSRSSWGFSQLCESHVLRADWLNSSPHVSVFWSSRLDPCAPKQRHTHARTHSLSHVQTRAHASHYTTSGGLKVDHYLLNRLPNKKRRIPLQACIKTLEAWRWSNIHHNWCVAKQITHISAHCSSYDSSNWTWQIP